MSPEKAKRTAEIARMTKPAVTPTVTNMRRAFGCDSGKGTVRWSAVAGTVRRTGCHGVARAVTSRAAPLPDTCRNTRCASCQSRQPSRHTSVSAAMRPSVSQICMISDVAGPNCPPVAGRTYQVASCGQRIGRGPSGCYSTVATMASAAPGVRRRGVLEPIGPAPVSATCAPSSGQDRRSWASRFATAELPARGGCCDVARGDLERVLSRGFASWPRGPENTRLTRLKGFHVEFMPVRTIETYSHASPLRLLRAPPIIPRKGYAIYPLRPSAEPGDCMGKLFGL